MQPLQRSGGILSGRGHKTPAALGSAAAVEASAACSGSAEAVLRWAQRSAASLGSALSRVMLAVHSPTVPPPLAWAGVTAPWKRTACCAHCGHLGVLAPCSKQPG